MSNPILTQANAILACPHVQWEPQARQLIPVIEGLVKETTRYREALIAIATFGCCNVGDDFCADDPNIHSIADYCTPCFANAHLVPTPTPATSGTHQPDSVTGDARQAFPLSPVPMLDDCMENIRRNVAEMDRIAAMEKDPLKLEPQVMTDTEIRIAIAEACGIIICPRCWWNIDPETCHCGDAINRHCAYDGHNPVPNGCTCGYDDADKRKAKEPQGPDYCYDLNAIHEALLELGPVHGDSFTMELRKIVVRDGDDKKLDGVIPDFWFYNATARQRAEAFLRTVNKWKEPHEQTQTQEKTTATL